MRQATSVALVAFCLLPSPAPAQTTLSLTGGVNLVSIATETGLASNYTSAQRPFTGIAATFPIEGPFQLRVGAAFSQKGNFYALDWFVADNPGYPTFGRSVPALDLHLKMGYLEFTFLGSLASRVSGGPVTVHVLAGPALGFLVSCKAAKTEYDRQGQPGETSTLSCLDDAEITQLDLGLAVGTGLNVELTDRMGFTTGIVYTHGLRDAGDVWVGSDPRDQNSDIDLSAKHRTLTLKAGLTRSIR